MLTHCLFDGRQIEIAFPNSTDANKFSIVVGRNGAGKSRLLGGLVNYFLAADDARKPQAMDPFFRKDPELINVEFTHHPTKVIAASASPFDKFPILQRSARVWNYRYLGLRGLYSPNLGLSFMAKIIGDLIRSVHSNGAQAEVVSDVLAYLGFAPTLTARFVLEIGKNEIIEILNSENPASAMSNRHWRNPTSRPPYPDLFSAQFEEILTALRMALEEESSSRREISIGVDGVIGANSFHQVGAFYPILLEAGLLRLRDVTLTKADSKKDFRIHDASSGEQCVVMTLLGIASHIENGALICIDEPEICLHPEWQERYMEKLITTFSGFKDCHFVIATHSPQIVSNLHNEDCFVIDLEQSTTTSAAAFSRRSADFQLANVFKAPGYKNEYLTRELLATLSSLSAGDTSIAMVNQAKYLLALNLTFQETDPVKKLMNILSSAIREITE